MSQGTINNLILGGQTSFDPSYLSAFGTLETGELTPVLQGDFVYGLNSQIWSTPTVTGTGASVGTNGGRLIIQGGTTSTGYAFITSRKILRYRAGQGNTVRVTPVFTTGLANSTQLFGVGILVSGTAVQDGYFYGYNGTSFGIAHYNRGVPTWIPQASWNNDPCLAGNGSFTYDPTKGTPCMIKYPYLGYGNIEFFLQNPDTSAWVLAHTIKYANTVSSTQLGNPSLQVLGLVKNSGNTTNLSVYCGSVGVFVSGFRSFINNPKWAADSSKSAVNSEVCLMNIKNCTTYNGTTNRGLIRLHSLSASSSANTNLWIRLKIGATLGGSPSYATINGTTADGGQTITSGNSVASVDKSATTVASGTYIFNLSVGPTSSNVIDLTPFELFIAPGEILTVSGEALANTNVGVSLNWSEDI